MDIPEAIDRTLNERWIPISEAKTLEVIIYIIDNSRCYLCISDISGCSDCLDTNTRDGDKTCCYEFIMWLRYTYSYKSDFKKAHYWAVQLVNKIKKLRKRYE